MKNTLLLPSTSFPLRPQPGRESALLAKVLATPPPRDSDVFCLHDGPPFANGAPHLGTALNKLLKDFTVRNRRMRGENVSFTPGWDCHGLPTELKAVKAGAQSPLSTRKACRELALAAVTEQMDAFKSMGVSADWDNRYLTMDYSATVVRTFAELLRRGLVYFARKPVWWSVGAQTALAQMELEYKDVTDQTAFVEFPSDGFSFVAWTTTPWTLPANRALAVNPEMEYLMGVFEKGAVQKTLVLASECVSNLSEWKLVESLRTLLGKELCSFSALAPFGETRVPVLPADFVEKSGTGVVHVAPGHGLDDYNLGLKHNLEVFSPVDKFGCYTAESPAFCGEKVSKADVLASLGDRVLQTRPLTHSYPRCWRTKTRVLSLATPQCFVELPPLMPNAMQAMADVSWLPEWGQTRLRAAMQTRQDWCVSRQRAWGVPVPVFYDETGQAVMSAEYACKVADVFERLGPDTWFAMSDAEFAAEAGVPTSLTRKTDTLDVWLDSGVSWLAVLKGHRADLYLEAVDQHRGWFQSSLLVAAALDKPAPYKTCLTHGWVVKDSQKFAKSSGFGAKPCDLANKYGTDVLRLWAATRDFTNDVEFDEKEFPHLQNMYQKFRGTLRVLLGNLSGFDPNTPVEYRTLDKWALQRLNEVSASVQSEYMNYRFAKGTRELHDFVVQVSSVYVAFTKDTLYCDAQHSARRRAAQSTAFHLFEHLVRLVAPVLPFLAQELWEASGHTGAVSKEVFLPPLPVQTHDWSPLFDLRDNVFRQLEDGRKEGLFAANSGARLKLVSPELLPASEMPEFFGVSDFSWSQGDFLATVESSPHEKCPRCWNHVPDALPVCSRCNKVMGTQGD